MIELTGTSACLMRDKLRIEWLNQKIKLSEIKDRLSKIDLPEWLMGQIIEMTNYRKYDRCTCPVEQAMFDAVCYHIVDQLMKEEEATFAQANSLETDVY